MNGLNKVNSNKVLDNCENKNDFSELTDEFILDLTQEEFKSVFGWESFMARLFEMERFRELDKYLDQIDLFTLVYFWYSTCLGCNLEKEYTNEPLVDLWYAVWQDLGQYVQCGWKAMKNLKNSPKRERGNMQGQSRKLSKTEKLRILDIIDKRIQSIRNGLKRDNEEFRVI